MTTIMHRCIIRISETTMVTLNIGIPEANNVRPCQSYYLGADWSGSSLLPNVLLFFVKLLW